MVPCFCVLVLILRSQNPHCEGHFQTRIPFDEKASRRERVLCKVYKISSQYVVEAGAAHGITDETLYKNRRRESKGAQLSTIASRQTDSFTTTQDIISDTSRLPEEGHARQTHVGITNSEGLRLRNYMNAPPSLIDIPQRTTSQEFLLVENEKAALSFTLEQDGILDFDNSNLGISK